MTSQSSINNDAAEYLDQKPFEDIVETDAELEDEFNYKASTEWRPSKSQGHS